MLKHYLFLRVLGAGLLHTSANGRRRLQAHVRRPLSEKAMTRRRLHGGSTIRPFCDLTTERWLDVGRSSAIRTKALRKSSVWRQAMPWRLPRPEQGSVRCVGQGHREGISTANHRPSDIPRVPRIVRGSQAAPMFHVKHLLARWEGWRKFGGRQS